MGPPMGGQDGHAGRSLLDANCRFQDGVLQRFARQSWATIKFWMMRLFETCPARLAAAVLTDTAEHERTHTDLKKFGIFTNQRKQTATLPAGACGGHLCSCEFQGRAGRGSLVTRL